jgi:hypothetical protein
MALLILSARAAVTRLVRFDLGMLADKRRKIKWATVKFIAPKFDLILQTSYLHLFAGKTSRPNVGNNRTVELYEIHRKV